MPRPDIVAGAGGREGRALGLVRVGRGEVKVGGGERGWERGGEAGPGQVGAGEGEAGLGMGGGGQKK